MLAHYYMTHDDAGRDLAWDGTKGPNTWLNACFEASVITGRIYVNVLGLFRSDKANKLYSKDHKDFRDDDVSASELGGSLVNLNSMSEDDRKLLLAFMLMADKASAHLTKPKNHDWQDAHEAIRRICQFLKAHLYEPTGRQCAEIDRFLTLSGKGRSENVWGTSPVVVHSMKFGRSDK
jgi:hypothetical protein